MNRVLEAIYENGVLLPLADPELPDNQRVLLELRELPTAPAPSPLEAWQQVYSGLSDEEIAEIERIALDRSHFLRSAA